MNSIHPNSPKFSSVHVLWHIQLLLIINCFPCNNYHVTQLHFPLTKSQTFSRKNTHCMWTVYISSSAHTHQRAPMVLQASETVLPSHWPLCYWCQQLFPTHRYWSHINVCTKPIVKCTHWRRSLLGQAHFLDLVGHPYLRPAHFFGWCKLFLPIYCHYDWWKSSVMNKKCEHYFLLQKAKASSMHVSSAAAM